MRLYSGKIDIIAQDILRSLTEEDDVEILPEEEPEALLDIAACLREYVRNDRELSERARALAEQRGLDQSAFGKLKRQLAERAEFGLGEDAVGWIADQILNILMHSVHVEEVFAEDHEMRRKIAVTLRKHMAEDEEMDREVRRRIKNVEEGSMAWDVEYGKVMNKMMQTRKLL